MSNGPCYYDTIPIAGCYLIALVNGDYSGLTDEDIDQLEKWYESYKPDGSFLTFIPADNPEIAIDKVSGLLAECYETQVFEG